MRYSGLLLILMLMCSCGGNGGDFVFVNSSPVLASVGNQLLREGDSLNLNLTATDPDATQAVSFSISPALSFATLTDHGDGTATLSITPVVGDEGSHEITVRATDNAASSSFQQEIIKVVVANFNTVPLMGSVTDMDSGAAIQDAIVTVRATEIQTRTTSTGSFLIYVDPSANQTIVAAKPGYFNLGQETQGEGEEGTAGAGFNLSLRPVTIGTNSNYNFVDPGVCQVCHPNQVNEWNGSIMATAGQNTWMHDIFNGDGTPGGQGGFVYTRDSVHANAQPDSVCASCHQPESYVSAGYSGPIQSPSDVGYPNAGATHGVSCETCHKIANVDLEKMNFPGIHPEAVTFNLPESGQVQYGLLPDVSFNLPGLMEPTYQPQLVAQVCGTCHQDQVDVHEDGTFAGVTSEPTFNEWKDSPYGDPNSGQYKTCIDCHMPPSGFVNICANQNIPRDPNTIRSHDIKGTSPEYLENAVELTVASSVVGSQLNVTVDIENTMAGHHVPTGVSIRNMILVVEAWVDGDNPLTMPLLHTGNQVIHEIGGIGDPAEGYFAGLPGKAFAKVNHDANMVAPVFFTEAAGRLFDTRIPALGTDSTTYSFLMPTTGTGTINVRARLIYRRAFRSLVDAKNWTSDGHGNKLADIEGPHYGHLMEQTMLSVPLSN